MKFQLIPDILYHVLYFEFTQNYGYSLFVSEQRKAKKSNVKNTVFIVRFLEL